MKKTFVMSFKVAGHMALALLFATGLLAQDQTAASIKENFAGYQQHRIQENVFVHTDKNMYIAGEICWFKVFDVDCTMHLPSAISKVCYVEVLGKNNVAVLQAKISLKDGK